MLEFSLSKNRDGNMSEVGQNKRKYDIFFVWNYRITTIVF